MMEESGGLHFMELQNNQIRVSIYMHIVIKFYGALKFMKYIWMLILLLQSVHFWHFGTCIFFLFLSIHTFILSYRDASLPWFLVKTLSFHSSLNALFYLLAELVFILYFWMSTLSLTYLWLLFFIPCLTELINHT